jgi:hypothetical protein
MYNSRLTIAITIVIYGKDRTESRHKEAIASDSMRRRLSNSFCPAALDRANACCENIVTGFEEEKG